jgi:hypothetical protein
MGLGERGLINNNNKFNNNNLQREREDALAEIETRMMAVDGCKSMAKYG